MRSWLAVLLVTTGSLSQAGQPTKRPSDDERGLELYERHCWQCHGERNRGRGPATAALVHRVPNLSGGRTKIDEATVNLVLRGRSAMPAFEASFDQADARRVLRFMATLGDNKSLTGSKPKPKPKPAPAKSETKVSEEPPAAPSPAEETEPAAADE